MEAKLQQQAPQQDHVNKPNLTGIPTQMKLDFEQRSGLSFDDVRVHYNSDKPAQLQALAYTQGTQVYVGPGQERHLPHELGHVAQQKMGYVRITDTIGAMPFNLDSTLEYKADHIQLCSQFNDAPQKSYVAPPLRILPIQCRLDIEYNKIGNVWNILRDTRPEFSESISPLFSDSKYSMYQDELKKTEEFAEIDPRTKDHIISYEAINKLLRGILFVNLNGTDKASKKRPLTKTPKAHKSNTTLNMLIKLVRMIIPKPDDYIVLHNLLEFDRILSLIDKKEPDSKAKEKKKEGLVPQKYLDMLDKQRKKAFSIVYSIDAILGPEEVDVAILNGLANDLEFLLNSSVGNLRLGDGSTNSSIHSHIDPIYNSFQLSKPTGSSKWDLNFDGASIEYIASAESGIDKLTISKLSFESSKRSMARRLYRLLTISEYLKNGNVPNSVEHGDTNEIVIPAFYVK